MRGQQGHGLDRSAQCAANPKPPGKNWKTGRSPAEKQSLDVGRGRWPPEGIFRIAGMRLMTFATYADCRCQTHFAPQSNNAT